MVFTKFKGYGLARRSFNFPYICLLFFPVTSVYPFKCYRQIKNLKKLPERLLAKLHPSIRGEYNLLSSTLTLRFDSKNV